MADRKRGKKKPHPFRRRRPGKAPNPDPQILINLREDALLRIRRPARRRREEA
jgi:hypothetical protein